MITRKPSEWVELTGIEVIDADGWEHGTWGNPITYADFIDRTHVSTCRRFDVQPMTRVEMYGNHILNQDYYGEGHLLEDWERLVSHVSNAQ